MKERLDKLMNEKGLVASRSQAKSLIEDGKVSVNSKIIKKAGELVEADALIEVLVDIFVGRGAFKLEKALEEFKPEIADKVLLDIGASTGGFTEILLKNHVKKVYAIDVGHDQLAEKIKADPRVINMERTNIKDLSDLPELADGAVIDLSFISITKVMDAVSKLVKPDGFLIALVKPQFEAGLERLPDDGVIKDPKVTAEILSEVLTSLRSQGWHSLGTIDSPILGKSGNKEFLSYFRRT